MIPRANQRFPAIAAVALSLPLSLGGCAIFTPILRAVDAALTPDPPIAEPAPRASRVKGYHRADGQQVRPSKSASKSRRDAAASPSAPSDLRPAKSAASQPPPSDEADPQGIAKEAEKLAAADASADAEVLQAVAEARTLMLKGEVRAARRKLLAAMTGNNPEVVLAFARTFDPNELARLPKSDAAADPVRARALYEHARQMGSMAASEALGRLPPAAAAGPKSQPAPSTTPVTPPATATPTPPAPDKAR